MARKKSTKKLSKGKKLESKKAPTGFKFKLVPVKTIGWAHD